MPAATIGADVAAFRESNQAQGPNAFSREQEQLATLVPTGVIAVGDNLPDAELLDVYGERTTLSAAGAGRRAVLVFYRGAWCPFCNIALRAYQTALTDELARREVALVAISPQKPDGSLTMQEKHELAFAVLSDPGNQLAAAAGILTAPSEEARAAQLQLGLDLAQVNADGTATLPMPTTVILDPDLTVRWIDVHPDYTTRTESATILSALDGLSS
jgi:peroxiredoxin